MKAVLWGALAVVLVAGGVVVGAGVALDSGLVRGRVVAALERATGHEVRIGGALRVGPGSLLRLAPVISAEDVVVLNEAGFSRAALVSARRVEVVVALWPLVSGRVEVRSVLVEGPDVLLERDAGGRGNWESAAPPVVTGAVAGPGSKGMAVEVGPVRIEEGRVAGLGMPAMVVRTATVTSDGGVVKVLVEGGVGDLPVSGMGAFRGGGAVVGELTADGGTVRAEGVVGPGGFEGGVSGAVPDLGRMAALVGMRAPGLQDVRFSGRIGPGAEGGVVVRGMQVGSSQGDMAGDLAVRWRPRIAVRGSLVGKRWLLDGWRMVAPVGKGGPVETVGAPAAADGAPALQFEVLRRWDGDVQVAVEEVVYRGGSYRAVSGRAVLQDGVLRVDPLQLTSPAGGMQGRLEVDAGAAPPRVAVVVHAPGLEAAGLAALAGGEGTVTGAVALEADLRSAGASWGAMAAGVSGRFLASLGEGDVDNALLMRVFGPVLRSAGIPVEAGGRSRVRCMNARLDAVDGQVRVETLGLDTTRLRLEGEGTVDLGGETMDVHLRPMIRIGGAGVSVPVRVTGPFRAPRAAADKGAGPAGRFGISIARLGGAEPSDPCVVGR